MKENGLAKINIKIESITSFREIFKSVIPFNKNILLLGDFDFSIINLFEKYSNNVIVEKFNENKINCNKEYSIFVASIFNYSNLNEMFDKFIFENSSVEIHMLFSVDKTSFVETINPLYLTLFKNNFEINRTIQLTYNGENEMDYYLFDIKFSPERKNEKQRVAESVPRDIFMEYAVSHIYPSDVVLDIGCGIRPQEFFKPKIHICFDPFSPYLDKIREKMHDKATSHIILMNGDWEKATEVFYENSVDTVFLLDIIEHLEKEEGERLLKLTEKIARKQIVIFTPYGFVPQCHTDGIDAWGLEGGAWQEHKSGWLPDDFSHEWRIISCIDFHTHDNEGVKYKKPEGALWAIKNYENTDVDGRIKEANHLLEIGENILIETNNRLKAKEYFFKAVLQNPKLSGAYNNIGVIDFQLDDTKSAESYIKMAQKIDKENKNYALNIMDIYLAQNDLGKAIDTLKLYLAKNPNEEDLIDELEKIKKKMETTNKNLLFSVIVPTYNQDQYLGLALDTLLAQTFTNWEAIVVNDGSTDNTAEVMSDYQKKDSRIKCFYKENGGVATALNEGIKQAKGEWICWLSSDDLFEPNKLQIHFDEIAENPEIKFFYTHWHILLDEKNQKIKPPLWFPIPKDGHRALAFFRGNYISGNSVAIHNSVFEKVGFFDERLWQGQDFDMWLKISSEFKTKFINKRTMTTRLHETQTTNTFQGGGVFDSTRSLLNFINSKKFSQYFPSNYLDNLENIKSAISEIVSIYSDKDSFIFGLGFNVSLIERMVEWVYRECNTDFRDEIEVFIKNKFNSLESLLDSTNWQSLKNTIAYKDFVFHKFDFSSIVKNRIDTYIQDGEQEKAYNLEKFLCNISKRENKIEYLPILFDVKLKEKKRIREGNLLNWQLSDHSLQSAKHFITYKCECGTVVKVKYNLSLLTESPKGEFICPECNAHYEFAENDFFNFIKKSLKQQKHSEKEISKIVFLTRDSQIVGGGNIIITKYINWLAELGYDVELISFGSKPDWVDLNANFKSIYSIEDLQLPENDNYIIIAGSIWEIPELLRRVNPLNVFLFCQGYEGYHYGKDYLSAVSDKPFFDQMHSLPFQVISVSSHLVELFYSKFNKKSYYIPNSINHSIFEQTIKYSKKSNSIVFIGNPSHPLKGFNYLLQSVQNLVSSKFLTEKVKLIVIVGSDKDLPKVREILDSSEIDDFELLASLSRNKVAEKINESKLLVCTSWYEGFSLPILEAMNCGTPVITTSNQGAESFCIDEYNSLIVDFGDITSLVKRIVAVFTNRINVEQLIENGKTTAAFFTESASFKSFVNSFSKITNRKFDPQVAAELENKLLNYESVDSQNSIIHKNVIDNELIEKPQFSIIVPTYNRPQSLKKALTSISEQTFKNFEVIVINDAGEDVTKTLSEFDKVFNYKLITHKTNKERSFSRNEGISLSTGRHILFLDDDDIFYPDHLQTFVENITNESLVIYTDANRAVYYSANGKQILNTKYVPYSMEFSREKLLIGNISPINCFCIERELLTEVGLFTEFINVLEDWELLLRLSQKTKFKHIKKTTCEVSWHSENTTSQKTKEFETIRNWIYKRNKKEIEKISEKDKAKIINEFNEIWEKDELYNSPLLSIIIPVYNKIEYTKQCLESIEKCTKSNYEIIIVDNASSDNTIEELKNSDIKIIANKENHGFPKAVNQGILEAKGDYILIANNDIVFTKNWLDRMLQIAKQHPEVGIIGPISNSVSGRQLDKNAKYKSIPEMHKYAAKIKKENKGQFFQFPRVAFLCTLIKKEVIDKIGGLDERYSPGNFEDDDFCLRAQMAGFKTVIATDVFIHHYGSVSFKADGEDKYAKRIEINREKFIGKWGADPEDIWIKGIKPKERELKYSISSDLFIQHIERSFINIDENELSFAIENLEIAIGNFKDSERKGFENLALDELIVILGNLYFTTNNLEKAKETFEVALNENPNSSTACQGLGEIFYLIEEYEASKTMFEWAIKNDGTNEVSKQKLTAVNELLGLNENEKKNSD